jgi:flagellar hook-associated protein 2
MATSSIMGNGSMIDVKSIVSQLMQIEQRPLQSLNARIQGVNVSISAFGDIKSKVDSLYASLSAIQDASVMPSKMVRSSDETVVKASISSSADASIGKLVVRAQQLATAQNTTFTGFRSKDDGEKFTEDLMGSKEFRIQLTGDWEGVDEGDTAGEEVTSLQQLAEQINADSVLQSRVRASIVNTNVSSAPYALVLTGSETGERKTFSASLTNVDGEIWGGGAAPVPADPSQPDTPITRTGSGLSLEETIPGGLSRIDIQALDAKATVQGVTVKSDTNVFKEAISGVSFELLGTSSTASYALTVAQDNSAMTAKVKSFATSLTDLLKKGQEMTKPATENSEAGPLAGNNGMLSLLAAVRSSYNAGIVFKDPSAIASLETTAYSGRGTSTNPLFWSAIGVEVARDGTVSVNESTLSQALSGSLGTVLYKGFTASMSSVLRSFQGTSGSVYSVIDSMRTSVKTLNQQKTDMSERLERKRASLTQQYATLDAKLVGMNQQMTGVRSALAGLSA